MCGVVFGSCHTHGGVCELCVWCGVLVGMCLQNGM